MRIVGNKSSKRRRLGGPLRQALIIVVILSSSFQIAALLGKSSTALSHFSRLELCSFCGLGQAYVEVGLFDHYPFRQTTRSDTRITHILRSGKEKPCEHCFYSVRERMVHLTARDTTFLTFRERGEGCGLDIFAHDKYVSAMGEIARTNPEAAQLIWSRTLRHSFNSNAVPIKELQVTLAERNESATKAFLLTNRYFRPARPNPERLFSSYRF